MELAPPFTLPHPLRGTTNSPPGDARQPATPFASVSKKTKGVLVRVERRREFGSIAKKQKNEEYVLGWKETPARENLHYF